MDRQLMLQERRFDRNIRINSPRKAGKKVKEVSGKLSFRLVRDKKLAEGLWRRFCKPQTVWDLWEIRKTFLDVYRYKVLFVEARKNAETVGVLPLWFSTKLKAYEWISGWYAEESRPFVKNKAILARMLSKVDGPLRLEAMKVQTAKMFPGKLTRDFDHFGLNLEKVGYDWEKYLMTIKKKKRQNIRRDIRSIIAMTPTVRYDNPEDIKHLFRLNKMQMRRKVKMYEDESLSVFETDKKQEKAFREMWKRAGETYRVRLITVLVGKKVVGCDFNLIYKNKYYTVLGGSDVNAVSGIGVFMNYLDIQDAIKEKSDYVDFLMENHYWKDDWFKPEKRYKYEKGEIK